MKYFEFGQKNPERMVMLHGISYGCRVLMEVLAHRQSLEKLGSAL